MSDYDMMVHKAQNIPLPIGRTGEVRGLAFSRSHGDIANVLMDDTNGEEIWCVKELDLCTKGPARQ